MKIISYGIVKPETKICGYCGAKFEYTKADIRSFYKSSEEVTCKFVCCPVCDKIIMLGDEPIKKAYQ